jgi:alkyl hydroperoxide reductase subunit AhpC
MFGEKAPECVSTGYFQGKKKKISHQDVEHQWDVIYWCSFDVTSICNSEIHGFKFYANDSSP